MSDALSLYFSGHQEGLSYDVIYDFCWSVRFLPLYFGIRFGISQGGVAAIVVGIILGILLCILLAPLYFVYFPKMADKALVWAGENVILQSIAFVSLHVLMLGSSFGITFVMEYAIKTLASWI